MNIFINHPRILCGIKCDIIMSYAQGTFSVLCSYRGTDKSLARPERKQATATIL